MTTRPNVFPEFCTSIDDDGVGTITNPNSGQKNAQPPSVVGYSVNEGFGLQQFVPRQILNHLSGLTDKWLKYLDFAIGDRTYTTPINIANDQVVTDSLESLDLAVGNRGSFTIYSPTANVTNSASNALNIESINVAIGDRGNFTIYAGSPNVTNSVSNATNIEALNTSIGDRNNFTQYATISNVSNGVANSVNIESLNIVVGDRNYVSPNYITTGESISSSLVALDTQLKSTSDLVSTVIPLNVKWDFTVGGSFVSSISTSETAKLHIAGTTISLELTSIPASIVTGGTGVESEIRILPVTGAWDDYIPSGLEIDDSQTITTPFWYNSGNVILKCQWRTTITLPYGLGYYLSRIDGGAFGPVQAITAYKTTLKFVG